MDSLKKQLELVRFERAIEYVANNAHGLKHLNAQELAHINKLLNASEEEPWRAEAAVINLPSGRKESLSILSNPMIQVRDIISTARERAREGEIVDAATDLYSQLVLHHFFKDGNRRSAVAAVYWLLLERDIHIPAIGLLELGIGDLRIKGQLEILKNLIQNTIAIAESRKR